jgi:hypothetical protein
MSRDETVEVRRARVEDLSILAGIEQLVWSQLKTEILNIHHFKTWLDVFGEGFWVAEAAGKVVGYLAYQKVIFDLDKLSALSFNQATDHGFIHGTHIENGNCFYGISSCSIHAGAGGALAKSGERMTIAHGQKCAIAYCRMPGFSQYYEGICHLNQGSNFNPAQENALALNYCLETAGLVGGKIGKVSVPALDLDLPQVQNRDPVIGRFLKYTEFYLAGVVGGYMKDPLSRDFAAILIFDNPQKNNDN